MIAKDVGSLNMLCGTNSRKSIGVSSASAATSNGVHTAGRRYHRSDDE